MSPMRVKFAYVLLCFPAEMQLGNFLFSFAASAAQAAPTRALTEAMAHENGVFFKGVLSVMPHSTETAPSYL